MKHPRLVAMIYVIGVCLLQADLYSRIGKLEHAAAHAVTGGCEY